MFSYCEVIIIEFCYFFRSYDSSEELALAASGTRSWQPSWNGVQSGEVPQDKGNSTEPVKYVFQNYS